MPYILSPAVRLALLYGSIFMGVGVNVPFLPLWLQERGLSPSEIGIIIGAPLLARVLATPLISEIADRTRRPALTLRVAAAVTIAFYVLVALAGGFWPILGAACLASASAAGATPLADTLAMSALRSHPQTYGRVRAWGSVAFIGGNVFGGAAVWMFGPSSVIWVLVGLQTVALGATFLCVNDDPRLDRQSDKAPPSRHLLIPGLLAVVLASSLIQASHAVYYTLGSVHWRALGLDGPIIGFLWGLGVAAEILLFWMSGNLSSRIRPAHFLLLGACAAMVRWMAMGWDPVGPALAGLQLLHAFSFGATFLGTIRTAASLAPPGLESRAQGLAATSQAIVMAAAMALAGQAYAMLDGATYLIMAAIAATGGLVVLGGWRLLRSAP